MPTFSSDKHFLVLLYSNMWCSFRLQDDHRNLSTWLTNQEDKWKEIEESREKTELVCQTLARKRYSCSCIKIYVLGTMVPYMVLWLL